MRWIVCMLLCHTVSCPFENSLFICYWNHIDDNNNSTHVSIDLLLLNAFEWYLWHFDSIRFQCKFSSSQTVSNRSKSFISVFIDVVVLVFLEGIGFLCQFYHCLLSQTDRKFIVQNICSFIEIQAIFPWSNVMRAERVQIKHGIYEKVHVDT